MCRMTFVLDFVVANVVGRPAFYKINHTWCTWRYEKKPTPKQIHEFIRRTNNIVTQLIIFLVNCGIYLMQHYINVTSWTFLIKQLFLIKSSCTINFTN